MEKQLVDHLFRHQFGKMVSILVRIFGVQHLETIEDAVQDTFITALKTWKNKIPDNPEAWLTTAAKNRVVDLFRKINAESNRAIKLQSGPSSIGISEMFLDHQIEDSQLRMIFTACHPGLKAKDQIAFALKTISGFSAQEIATALLTPFDTVKKRLQRARKTITTNNYKFEIPQGEDLIQRLDRVMEVIYLIFNEGFQSNKKEILLRKELCGEALRLCSMLLGKEKLRSNKLYALFALLCFHSARLDSKISDDNEIIPIKNQNRKNWNMQYIFLGNDAMNKAVDNNTIFTSYHYEAAIASEHLRASSFETTDWRIILKWYNELYRLQSSHGTLLNIAIVHLQLSQFAEAEKILKQINATDLAQRSYLYYATLAEYYHLTSEKDMAIENIQKAIEMVSNHSERKYLESKRNEYQE